MHKKLIDCIDLDLLSFKRSFSFIILSLSSSLISSSTNVLFPMLVCLLLIFLHLILPLIYSRYFLMFFDFTFHLFYLDFSSLSILTFTWLQISFSHFLHFNHVRFQFSFIGPCIVDSNFWCYPCLGVIVCYVSLLYFGTNPKFF